MYSFELVLQLLRSSQVTSDRTRPSWLWGKKTRAVVFSRPSRPCFHLVVPSLWYLLVSAR